MEDSRSSASKVTTVDREDIVEESEGIVEKEEEFFNSQGLRAVST